VTALTLNPYADVAWDEVDHHKAQLHAHTSYPDVEGHSGSDSPDVVVDDYREAGYSVLALTGHEYNIAETTWPWTDWDRDPRELGMVAVRGAELGGSDDGIDYDLLSLSCDLADTTGMTVDEALAAIDDRGGLALFPHPGRYHDDGEWYVEYALSHSNLLGIEVVNAADRYPTDRDVWDDLLERVGTERPFWGFANDDYHGREAGYSFDRSRNVLLLEDLTEAAVRETLVAGQFFYQHVVDDDPPVVERVGHDPGAGVLAVESPDAAVVQWISDGEVVGRGPRLDYGDADVGSYLRARLLGDSGSETGTQPFLVD